MQELALPLVNDSAASNLGDRLLQHVLLRLLRERGVSILGPRIARETGRIGRARGIAEFLDGHSRLLAGALRGRMTKNARATVLLPPGQVLGGTLACLPRVLVKLLYLGLLKALGVRIVSLGRGFPVRTRASRFQEAGIARLADYYGLRDSAGIEHAGAAGIRNATWFPDLSWLGPPPLAAQIVPFRKRSTVVLCFRDFPDRPANDPDHSDRLLASILHLMDEAERHGIVGFTYVCHDTADQPLMTAIRETWRGGINLRCEPGVLSLEDVPRIYGTAALVLTNRLHALLLGLQWGAVGLALIRGSRQEKIPNQMIDLGLGEHVIDVETHEPPAGIVGWALKRHGSVDQAVGAFRGKSVRTARLALAHLFSGSGAIPATTSVSSRGVGRGFPS